MTGFNGIFVLFVCVCLVCCAGSHAAPWHGQDRQPHAIGITFDFVDGFAAAEAVNALEASASHAERSGGVELPGIFLHPKGAEDAVLTYPRVAIPAGKPFLLFRMGIRDGVNWDSKTAPPNGVRFKVAVDGREVFAEELAATGWQSRAVDLSPWQGRTVEVALRTNAIEGNTSYDWATFGEVLLVSMPDNPAAPDKLPANAVGTALALVGCAEPSKVSLSMAGTVEETHLTAGEHWLPLHFDAGGAHVELTVTSGVASLERVIAGVYAPDLRPPKLTFSSPFVTAGRPFTLLCELRNDGRGTFNGVLRIEPKLLESPESGDLSGLAGARQSVPALLPGESVTLGWQLTAAVSGNYAVKAGPTFKPFHVFHPEPPLSSVHHTGVFAKEHADGPVAAVVGNGLCRLSIVRDEPGHDAYAVAQLWDGTARKWRRAGSLYPLARFLTAAESGGVHDGVFRFESAEAAPGELVLHAGLGAAQVRIVFRPEQSAPRIGVETHLTAGRSAEVLAFSGPVLLGGDRAFGVRKDFAIFPGLEYLHGDEESSSPRDLAYPHCDRRVPAHYKITTPLMAVQAQQALVALLFDMNQEWAPGETFPAARFLAPAYDSGLEYIHMSLFAPSVGGYVPENSYRAETPYRLERGGTLTLRTHLVLDHASNYAGDHIVHGPHEGGLVLQAMRHWFDVYGMPGPSPQPRSWDAERALCRHAYNGPIYSEDPPGWRHCVGWEPGLLVGHAVPQLLDLRLGVDEVTRATVEDHIGRVLERGLREEGPHYFWTGAGCHIMAGELPFYAGHLGPSLDDMRRSAYRMLDDRENGLWVWRPAGGKYESLGIAGDHTLGQAAHPSMLTLRAARLTGDPDLAARGLEAMRQMERYEVPRGAQMWECPLYQPDILAAAHAIRAYCEAYRLTGDPAHLEHARYWAWTGLPFLYFWEMDGYPAMRYNVISVIGSTFYHHSWLGLPVVWCGLVYAYALQDLAEFDASFPWNRVAQGITNSAMWQQYPEGTSKGAYPDSWSMAENEPRPADINPENILVNELRLRSVSPHIRFARFDGENGGAVVFNTSADIVETTGSPAAGAVTLEVRPMAGACAYGLLAPVPPPAGVTGVGPRLAGNEEQADAASGWYYDQQLNGVIMKWTGDGGSLRTQITW